jgi:hypothetical protein
LISLGNSDFTSTFGDKNNDRISSLEKNFPGVFELIIGDGEHIVEDCDEVTEVAGEAQLLVTITDVGMETDTDVVEETSTESEADIQDTDADLDKFVDDETNTESETGTQDLGGGM